MSSETSKCRLNVELELQLNGFLFNDKPFLSNSEFKTNENCLDKWCLQLLVQKTANKLYNTLESVGT